ncbi:polysaccharide deacetylase [Parasedimentitalea maritima]|uniref:Polysaccharide deacetylase n=1 Tax=Parasedimentitalea maritima TaxID=2578117 RepID=A0ABY2V6C8_9RHOB|nr:polysaccharide deacetylase family protein [Zongyanglinia marina]TLP69269.1 polysaccharide deacetylase [Zongyanglinia marina]
MSTDWAALDQELQTWVDQGLTLPLWWRDDDAIAPTAELDQLTALSTKLGLPVHLAVIPKGATKTLADYLTETTQLIPVVHGWAHLSHAPKGEKKAEFGAHRPVDEIIKDASQGLRNLQKLFGPELVPMFVPPWNRIAAEVVQELPGLGFTALSTFTPRTAPLAAEGLAQINTHLDPIHWKGSRSVVPPQQLLDQATKQLNARRLGRADNTEPYGILTHHLVHDAEIWRVTEALIARLMAGPACPWTLDTRNLI